MKLDKALGILEDDRRLTLLLGLTHFFVAAAYSLFDIGATSLLIANLGPEALPQVYLGSAAVLIFVGLVIIPVVDQLDRFKLFATILASFAAMLLAWTHIEAYRALYIASYLMKGLVFLQFWLLAGDLLDMRQAKRVFPVLLGCSLSGGLIASISASVIPRWLPSESLLTLSGALLVATLVTVFVVARTSRLKRRPLRAQRSVSGLARRLKADLNVSFSSPLVRTLSICGLLLALLAQILDYLLGTAAHSAYADASGNVATEGLTSFYAMLNGAVIGAGALVQFFLANRIFSSIGVIRGQLFAPITLLGGFTGTTLVWLAGGPFFAALVVARALQKSLRISLVRTSTDLVYNAIPADRRGRAKAFKETLIEPTGVLLSGLLLMAASRLPLSSVLGGALVLSVVFLLATSRLKDYYVESLVGVLKERSRFRFAFPSVAMRVAKPAEEPPSVSGLRRALENDEASIRLLAVEVASELKEPEAANLLIGHVREEADPEVRRRMIAALGKMVRGHDADESGADIVDLDPSVRATGMESIAQSGILRLEQLKQQQAEEDAEAEPQRDVSDETDRGTPVPGFVDQGSGEVTSTRRRMMFELARSKEKQAIERLIHYLEEGDGATRHLAARALESCGETAIGVLTLALWSTDVEGRRYVIRALDGIGTPEAYQSLLPVLSLEAEEAYYELLRIEAIRDLPRAPSLELLEDSLGRRVRRGRRNAHQILRAVFISEPGMRLILSNLNHPDRFIRSSAIEALEVRVDPALLGGILPLFEHESPRAIAEQGVEIFELPRRKPLDALVDLTHHRSRWIRACAVYALGDVGDAGCLGRLEELASDKDELTRLNAIESIGRIGDAGSVTFLEHLGRDHDSKMEAYALAAVETIRSRTGGASQPRAH